ncbi:Shikimate kinase [Dehalogenimonas lykanthroporepellens BL-DC-9]|jgi:shikimate kinase|nr:Shikimate kinase [Dehalogenimonas lykanthroporepellens BL-DC-9]
MKSNIALIGFMGSGKSSVGKRLARRLGRDFLETDRLVEEAAGATIADIFRESGEGAFRELEAGVIKNIGLTARNAVIACGGGIITRPENLENLKRDTTIIYLKTGVEELQERLAHSRRRPLLERPDREKFIRELIADREPLYRAAADITVGTGRRSFTAVVDEIISRLELHESHHR